MDDAASGHSQPTAEAAHDGDPTTLKPQDGNPFSSE
jgi:hypothetical protein